MSEVEMRETWINDRWPLLLPMHRHLRDSWPWWEAGRLASMAHHLDHREIFVHHNGYGAPGCSKVYNPARPREVVYDVGAEEGDFPALFSSWGCDVVLFEPNDRVWANIKAIWEANELRPPVGGWSGFAGPESDADVRAEMAQPGQIPRLWDWPECAYGEVIHDHGFCNLSERPDISVITIDDMVRLSDKPPTAITIDCEGAEFEVLLGAQTTLREYKPKCWISVHPEFAAEMYGRDQVLEDIQSLFSEAGYENWRGTFLAMDHEWHYYWGPE